MPKEGDLRIWWMPNPPRRPYYVEVESVKEVGLVINTLSGYDLYLKHLVSANAFGLEEYENGEWSEWYSRQGNDIMAVLDGEEE